MHPQMLLLLCGGTCVHIPHSWSHIFSVYFITLVSTVALGTTQSENKQKTKLHPDRSASLIDRNVEDKVMKCVWEAFSLLRAK